MQTPDGKGGSPLRLNISGYSLNLEYSQKGIWKVKYKLQNNERIISEFVITVNWTGKWHDRYSEMENELDTYLNVIKR